MLNHLLIPSLKRRGIGLGIFLLASAVVAAFVNPVFTIAGVAVLLVLWFLVRNLDFGLLILVFFFPYLGLVIDFGQFEIFQNTLYLKNINAPFVDLYGLTLLVAWALHWIYRTYKADKTHRPYQKLLRHLPHVRSYLLFWLSGLISLFKVPSVFFATSLKYFARPFTFAYLVFFVPVVSILTRVYEFPNLRDSEYSQTRKLANSQILLHRALLVFFWTGLLSAFNGLLGLFFGVHEGFPRATPFGFFGINPLGPNHNLLAETLIATAPAGLILSRIYEFTRLRNYEYSQSRNLAISQIRWIMYGMFFQWAVALLTFARTAWIAVAAQAIVYLVLRRRQTEDPGTRAKLGTGHSGRRIRPLSSVSRLLRQYWPVALAAALVGVVFLGVTVFSETVRGSTLSRLDQARIAAFYFERAPIFGQGIGTFVPTLWQTKAYLLEYGEPLEAHGILFKLAFEQGLFGLVAFGVFAGAVLVSLYRTYRSNRTYKTALIVALMIAGGSLTYQLFNTTYYTSKLWIPLAIAVAISRICAVKSAQTR